MMECHSNLLLSLINDVIDYSRISSDSLLLNIEFINLRSIIEEIKTICKVHLRPNVEILIKFNIED